MGRVLLAGGGGHGTHPQGMLPELREAQGEILRCCVGPGAAPNDPRGSRPAQGIL